VSRQFWHLVGENMAGKSFRGLASEEKKTFDINTQHVLL
jgi:hypothetical protein